MSSLLTCGSTPSSMPTMNTASHSRPLAEWTVDRTTAFSGAWRSEADCSAIFAANSSSDRHDDAFDHARPLRPIAGGGASRHRRRGDLANEPAGRREIGPSAGARLAELAAHDLRAFAAPHAAHGLDGF